MEKTHYVICFDIFDDRRRRRIVKHLERFSHRIQYSVFCVDADEERILKIRQGIERWIDEEDSLFIFPIESHGWQNKIIYGEKDSGIKNCDAKVVVI